MKEQEKSDKKKSLRFQKKDLKEKTKDLPTNFKELPSNIKHLVKDGDLELVVPADGNCGINSGSGHIFQDPKYGKQLRMILNNHMADRWIDFNVKFQVKFLSLM